MRKGAGADFESADEIIKEDQYAKEIINRAFFSPKNYPVNASITLKLADITLIPKMIQEVLDQFYFPITCHVDFYYKFNSSKRPEISIAYPSIACACNSIIRIRRQADVDKLNSEMSKMTFEKIAQSHAKVRNFDMDASGVSILGLLALQVYISSYEQSFQTF